MLWVQHQRLHRRPKSNIIIKSACGIIYKDCRLEWRKSTSSVWWPLRSSLLTFQHSNGKRMTMIFSFLSFWFHFFFHFCSCSVISLHRGNCENFREIWILYMRKAVGNNYRNDIFLFLVLRYCCCCSACSAAAFFCGFELFFFLSAPDSFRANICSCAIWELNDLLCPKWRWRLEGRLRNRWRWCNVAGAGNLPRGSSY